MKILKIIMFIVTILSLDCVKAMCDNKNVNQTIEIDSVALKAKKLKRLYLLSTASSVSQSDMYKQEFFNEFPSTFRGLNELYGYNSKTQKPSPLYYKVGEHILDLFNNIHCVNDTVYYKKIVSIALGGHWDADAVNAFQAGLRTRVIANPELIEYILKNKSDDETRSFWYFYFDGVHPKKQLPDALKRIKSINNKGYELMIEAQNEVLTHPKE